jgi:hypothetical protein
MGPRPRATGEPLDRRAIQLGLRGDVLARYAGEWLLDVEDISEFVREQRVHAHTRNHVGLVTLREDVYTVADAETAARLELSSVGVPS